MSARSQRAKRMLEVTRVARRIGLLRVLREFGIVGGRPPTRKGAREFRQGLEQLGTAYLKLGQLLSSRPDLLPDIYIEELGKLVDAVPPVPFAELEPLIEREVGGGVFARIDPVPLATASIAQIHAALLNDGREVVVKIRRPDIVREVEIDLDLLRSLVAMAERHSQTARLLQLSALAEDLESHLRGELDFTEEAHNTELIADLISDSKNLVVPKVIWPYVTGQLLVLERIHGEKITPGHGLSPEHAHELACELFRAYVKQITVAGLYHADPHRGNILLTDDGRLALLDFGLLGRLDEDTRTTLSLLLIAHAQNRTEDLSDLILDLSLTSMDSDEAGFVHELRRKLPRFHWRSLSGIQTSEALAEIQRTCLRYGIRVPPSFALVSKTLSQADAIARTLDPDLDPIELLQENAFTGMVTEIGRRLQPTEFLSVLVNQAQPLVRLPRRLGRVVTRLETGTLKIGLAPTDATERLLRTVANRIGLALIIAALLLASAQVTRSSHELSVTGFIVAAVLGLYVLWKILRTPGEL